MRTLTWLGLTARSVCPVLAARLDLQLQLHLDGLEQEESEVGLRDWRSVQKYLARDGYFRRSWCGSSAASTAGKDAWKTYVGKGGGWERHLKKQRNRRRRPRTNRSHTSEWGQRLLPCETSAIDSSRHRPGARSKRPLLDRMPCRAARAPLEGLLAGFATFQKHREPEPRRDSGAADQSRDDEPEQRGEGDATDAVTNDKKCRSRHAVTWAAAPTSCDGAPTPYMPTGADWDAYRRLCNQNATCFHALEQAHPINFFEQRDVCTHCGCERVVTMNSKHCCQHGSLLMERDFPEELLRLISIAPGLSKQSRAANDLFRFAQMALPKGTHRIPDSYQHLKVTGIPFAVLSNLNERSSTRAFLDDPSERLDASDRYCAQVRPSEAAIETIRTVMESTNCLVRQLINWSEASHQTARLVLKWPGTSCSPVQYSTAQHADRWVSRLKSL